MRRRALALVLLGCGCATVTPPQPVEVVPKEPTATVSPAAEVVTRFVRAVRQDRFDEALALTASRWRSMLNPSQFQADFLREPLAAERLARLERASTQCRAPGRCEVMLDGMLEATVIEEASGWRLEALTH